MVFKKKAGFCKYSFLPDLKLDTRVKCPNLFLFINNNHNFLMEGHFKLH